MKLNELRPGMENLELWVEILSIGEPREVETYSGLRHMLIECEIKDETTQMGLTVWNETIEELKKVKPSTKVKLINCFITSFKGVLSVNIGRESTIEPQ
jgi:ssDNA-binding replication factor A large subunit